MHWPPLPRGMFLVLIYTRGGVDPRAMVRSEGNMLLKNPVTPPGIDPGTIRLVAQHLNHYATTQRQWLIVKAVRSSIGSFHVTWYLGGCWVRLAKRCNLLHTNLRTYSCVTIINTVHFDITKHCSHTKSEVQTVFYLKMSQHAGWETLPKSNRKHGFH
jgi:hypothetical protein